MLNLLTFVIQKKIINDRIDKIQNIQLKLIVLVKLHDSFIKTRFSLRLQSPMIKNPFIICLLVQLGDIDRSNW
jgi:hypothetical protein